MSGYQRQQLVTFAYFVSLVLHLLHLREFKIYVNLLDPLSPYEATMKREHLLIRTLK